MVLDGINNLNATMTLWRGSTSVGSWSGSGKGFVALKGNCPAVNAETYALIVTGTSNGVPFSSPSFSQVC